MGVVVVHVRYHSLVRACDCVVWYCCVRVEDAETFENLRRGFDGDDDYGFLVVVEFYRLYLGRTNWSEGSVLRHSVVREFELDDALPGVSRVFGSGCDHVFVGDVMDERIIE